MIKIWKYPLHFDGGHEAAFFAPPGNLLKVAKHDGAWSAWVEHQVRHGMPYVRYHVRLVMTGEELPDTFAQEWEHVDTVLDGWLVLHVFRASRPSPMDPT